MRNCETNALAMNKSKERGCTEERYVHPYNEYNRDMSYDKFSESRNIFLWVFRQQHTKCSNASEPRAVQVNRIVGVWGVCIY